MKRVFNFSAGPSVLPESVLQKAADEMLCYGASGQSVMEMSHRSKDYEPIIAEAEALVRQNMGISDNYHVLFLQGGASLQFHMLPLNFMTIRKKADFTLTGAWPQKAIEEAQKLGTVNIVGSSKDKKWSYLPEIKGADPEADYFHICNNNTIEGTQYHQIPDVGNVPLIGDISSSALSAPMDVNRFAVLYAGAQKNLGPAGLTLVIIRKDMMERIPAGLPSMLSYKVHADNQSMFNTPPCYAIYIFKLVQEWIRDMGGPEVVFRMNAEKAKLLYDYLDSSSFFYNPVEKAVRSLMNVPFLTREQDAEKADVLNKKFVKEAEAAGLVNLAGHRSVGGMRASIYNAMPLEGVKALVAFMKEFESKNA
ncbi:MAG TPA: 3-phosphoserine/phosphohydroxythreonine transaminase [Deltaproteobacteria bacterium]|nr:3-phosphoserine/phosphohydroxythreonine transaminase [Deltaproteobacteria bacterium]HQB38551.1 3-phosphoserine/phosphohydroxythreonine transaminase [Deltaproteobacteria bacterium]